MTPINPTCPHAKVNASNRRRPALNRSRRHGVALAYDGVTAAYIRDIASGRIPLVSNGADGQARSD
jgi:hypothetical protein